MARNFNRHPKQSDLIVDQEKAQEAPIQVILVFRFLLAPFEKKAHVRQQK